MELATDGSQCRLATTDEMIEIAEKVSGKKLDWFFEVYLRNATLPKLNYKNEANRAILWWETENNLPFDLPVEVKLGNKSIRIEMINGRGEISLTQDVEFIIDPDNWILMQFEK
jgi:aminopeptidase N